MKSFKELSENLKEDLGLGKVHLPSNQQVMAINRQLKADAPEVLKDYRKLLKALDKSAVTGQEIVYIRDEPDEKYRKKTGFGDAHRVVMRKRTKSPLGKEVVYHAGSNETTYNTVLAFKEEYVHEGTSASQRGEPQTPHTKKEYDALSPKEKKIVDARKKAAWKQGMSRNPSESPRNYKKRKPTSRRGGVSKYGRGTEEVEIDELSKKTMGRYVKRASRDLAGTEYSLGRAEIDEPGKKQFKRLAKRSNKRLKGIGTAAKKLSKEDVEIDEITVKSMDQGAALKVYEKLKKGSKVTVEFGSAMSSTNKPIELVVSNPHRVVGKSKVGRIILKNPDGKGVKYTLFNRDGKISLAQGDMGTILKDLKIMKESVNEGVVILPKRSSRGGDVKEVGMDKRGNKTQYWWKHKNGLKNVFDSIEKLRYSLRNDANFKDAEEITKQLAGKKSVDEGGMGGAGAYPSKKKKKRWS